MNNLNKIYFILFFIFYRPIISVAPNGLHNEKNERSTVVEEIKRLQAKKRLARRRKNKKIKEIKDFVTTSLATFGLFSVGYIFYKMFFQKKPSEPYAPYTPSTPSGFSFFKNPETYSPGSSTLSTPNRCLLFSVANALSWEPDFVWPEAEITDDGEGKKMDRIEKARRIVKFLDAKFKEYAKNKEQELNDPKYDVYKKNYAPIKVYDLSKNDEEEALKKNNDIEGSENARMCLLIPEIVKEANGEYCTRDVFINHFLKEIYPLIVEKIDAHNLDDLSKVIKNKIDKENAYPKKILDHLNKIKENKYGSMIVGNGYHYVCIHYDGEKLIQSDDTQPSNTNVWPSIKSDLEKFFGVI